MKALLLPLASAVAFCFLGPDLAAQDYWDLLNVRNRPLPFKNALQFRAGAAMTIAENEDKTSNHEDETTGTGFVYYHTTSRQQKAYDIDIFAGRQGVYVGVKDHVFSGKQNQSRLEIYARPLAFYREGFYRSDDFVPTGRYEGQNYGVRLGVGRAIDKSLRLEAAGFFENMSFSRGDDTEIDYRIPDDHIVYGARMSLEQSTMQLNRTSGLPEQGYLATVALTREQNDSDRSFGVIGSYESTLPRGLWRASGHLEYYFKGGDYGVWEVVVDGSIADEKDRIHSYRSERPVGHWWGDGTVGYRMQFGDSFFVTPYGHVQFTRALNDIGRSAKDKYWFGGGITMAFAFGDGMALVAEYSYLNNPFRPSISWTEDTYGETQIFVGLDVTFGTKGQ